MPVTNLAIIFVIILLFFLFFIKMKYFAIFAFFTCVIFSSHVSSGSLKLVHVFFRHGSRTPELKDVYANDPYKADSFQPMGWGQLTNHGKQMSYKLGKLLRKRYDSFLGDIYYPDIVEATSTDFDRTKISALLALAGLFRPSPSQQWDEEVSWLPIPYQYDKDSVDYYLRRPNSYCPTYMKELDEVLQSDETIAFLKENKKTLDYLAKNTGRPMKKLLDVFSVYQTLKAEDYLNFTLPEWTATVYPKEVSRFASKQCELENSNAVLKRLNGGRMLGRVIKQMVDKSTDSLEPEGRKIFLYSGHENNVINILAAMNLYNPHVPNYSAAVLIELHYMEKLDDYAVKVVYSRDVDWEPEEQKLPNCEVFCPLDKFVEITKPHVPVNYTAECGSDVFLN